MKIVLIFIAHLFLLLPNVHSQGPCTPTGDETTYGTNDTWIGYVYDNSNFTAYNGFVNEGTAGNPNFNESFGGDNVNYPTSGCPVYTETFSVRYKLQKTFASGNYEFTVGGDDGFRLSIDGGATWIISQWWDQGYNTATYSLALNGTYQMVLEFYENGGGNQVSFNVQPTCIGTEDQSVYGTGNTWKGYIYDGMNFSAYKGMVTEGSAATLDFDERFGGDNVTYNTSACGVQTETFSARYRLQKNFSNGNYSFTVGGDDGYRLSFDGGATWAVDHWGDQSYNTSTYNTILNGTYSLVLEFYENGGQNRISIATSVTLLPVSLKTFEGKKNNNAIALNWITALETNTAYYVVERSVNGSDFTVLQQVSVTANDRADKTYRFTDESPADGMNYYRLKMVDKDLSYTYSPVIRIAFQATAAIDIYPAVLANGQAFLLKVHGAVKNMNVDMYDMSGKKLQALKTISLINAGQTVTLRPGNYLSKGAYILLCSSGGNIMKKQVIIVQ